MIALATPTAPVYGDLVAAAYITFAVLLVAVGVAELVKRIRAARARVDQVLTEELQAVDIERWRAELEQPAACCPSPAAAARNLCRCHGGGVGTWMGSAS